MAEVKLMKGNEVIAEAAIRCGCDAYYGYPITPQSEVMETLMLRKPWEETGMVVLQAESELASINMVYGAAACGKKAMTSSSSPGMSLMQEGVTYLAGAELPCLVVNVVRGGPGLGTIQPAQSDYFQATKGGGHGDYHLIVLAPASVQEMNDFVGLGFDLAFKYRNPAMILADGVIGQMMEKVELSEIKPRWTQEEIDKMSDSWALTGKKHIVTTTRLLLLNLTLTNKKSSTTNFRLNTMKWKRTTFASRRSNARMQTTCSWLTDQLPVFAKRPYNCVVKKESKWESFARSRFILSRRKKWLACQNKLKVS